MIILFKSKRYFLIPLIILGLFAILSIGTSKDTPETKTLNIGFTSDLFSGINMRDAKSAIDLYTMNMVGEINKKYGIKFRAVSKIFNNKTELIEAIQNKEVDFVSSTTKEYIEIKDQFDLEPAMVNNKKDKNEFFVLLINKGKNIKSISDLKGKKILVVSGGKGDLALTWLGTELMKQGFEDCDKFFSEIKRTEKQNQSIMPVFFGQYDACITFESSFKEMVNLNPQVLNKIFIFKQSKMITYGLMFFNKWVDKRTKEIVLETAINLENYPAGKQILKLFQNSGVTNFTYKDIQPIDEILKDYIKLKNKDKKVK